MSPYDDLLKEFEDMRQRMRKWLEYSTQYRVSNCFSGKTCWIPAADIHETEQAYHIIVDLAGIDPETIYLEVRGNVLHMNGERRRPQVESCNRVHQLEIDYGTFRRVFQFPSALDQDGAESNYRNGFLEVILPKLSKPTSVQIPLREE